MWEHITADVTQPSITHKNLREMFHCCRAPGRIHTPVRSSGDMNGRLRRLQEETERPQIDRQRLATFADVVGKATDNDTRTEAFNTPWLMQLVEDTLRTSECGSNGRRYACALLFTLAAGDDNKMPMLRTKWIIDQCLAIADEEDIHSDTRLYICGMFNELSTADANQVTMFEDTRIIHLFASILQNAPPIAKIQVFAVSALQNLACHPSVQQPLFLEHKILTEMRRLMETQPISDNDFMRHALAFLVNLAHSEANKDQLLASYFNTTFVGAILEHGPSGSTSLAFCLAFLQELATNDPGRDVIYNSKWLLPSLERLAKDERPGSECKARTFGLLWALSISPFVRRDMFLKNPWLITLAKDRAIVKENAESPVKMNAYGFLWSLATCDANKYDLFRKKRLLELTLQTITEEPPGSEVRANAIGLLSELATLEENQHEILKMEALLQLLVRVVREEPFANSEARHTVLNLLLSISLSDTNRLAVLTNPWCTEILKSVLTQYHTDKLSLSNAFAVVWNASTEVQAKRQILGMMEWILPTCVETLKDNDARIIASCLGMLQNLASDESLALTISRNTLLMRSAKSQIDSICLQLFGPFPQFGDFLGSTASSGLALSPYQVAGEKTVQGVDVGVCFARPPETKILPTNFAARASSSPKVSVDEFAPASGRKVNQPTIEEIKTSSPDPVVSSHETDVSDGFHNWQMESDSNGHPVAVIDQEERRGIQTEILINGFGFYQNLLASRAIRVGMFQDTMSPQYEWLLTCASQILDHLGASEMAFAWASTASPSVSGAGPNQALIEVLFETLYNASLQTQFNSAMMLWFIRGQNETSSTLLSILSRFLKIEILLRDEALAKSLIGWFGELVSCHAFLLRGILLDCSPASVNIAENTLTVDPSYSKKQQPLQQLRQLMSGNDKAFAHAFDRIISWDYIPHSTFPFLLQYRLLQMQTPSTSANPNPTKALRELVVRLLRTMDSISDDVALLAFLGTCLPEVDEPQAGQLIDRLWARSPFLFGILQHTQGRDMLSRIMTSPPSQIDSAFDLAVVFLMKSSLGTQEIPALSRALESTLTESLFRIEHKVDVLEFVSNSALEVVRDLNLEVLENLAWSIRSSAELCRLHDSATPYAPQTKFEAILSVILDITSSSTLDESRTQTRRKMVERCQEILV